VSGHVWLTRDSSDDDGALSEVVDVWSSRPAMADSYEGCLGVLWLCGEDAPVQRLPVEVAQKTYATIPETDRECVRIPCR